MIAIFAGRKHHTLKLDSVYQELSLRGLDPVWIVTRNSLNIDPPYEFIGANFRHLYSYSKSSIAEIDQIADPLQGLSANYGLNTGIAPYWVTHSIREAAESIVLFRKAMADFDAAIVLHENNFWGKILAYICHEQEKPCFAFQEGILRHADQETMNKQSTAAKYSDILFTWSEEDLGAYTEAGIPAEKIRPVGPVHLDQWIQFNKNMTKKEFEGFVENFYYRYALPGPPLVYAPPLSGHFEGDYWQTMEKILKNGRNVVVRPHPFEQTNKIQEMCNRYGAMLHTGNDLFELLTAAKVVIGQHSTIGVECAFIGKLFIQVDFDNVGIKQPVATAPIVHDVREIQDVIDNSTEYLDKMFQWQQERRGVVDGMATERAVNIIQSLL